MCSMWRSCFSCVPKAGETPRDEVLNELERTKQPEPCEDP
jgi:hypothetical protein